MTLQYRIEFTSITAFGNKKSSTVWMNDEKEALSSKWLNESGAVIITRERPVFPTFKDRKINAK